MSVIAFAHTCYANVGGRRSARGGHLRLDTHIRRLSDRRSDQRCVGTEVAPVRCTGRSFRRL